MQHNNSETLPKHEIAEPKPISAQSKHSLASIVMLINNKLNTIFVSMYKIFGFTLLAGIVLGMFAYLSVTCFYQLSTRWILPEILTPQNEVVARASLNYLSQQYQLQKLKVEKMEAEGELDLLNTQHEIKVQFEEVFARALSEQRVQDALQASELSKLAKKLSAAVPRANETIESLTAEEKTSLTSARNSNLLDRREILSREHFLTELEVSSVERQQKLAELRAELNRLKYSYASSNTNLKSTEKSYNINRILQEKDLTDSRLERLAIENRLLPLKKKLDSLNELIKAYEASVQNLAHSPFVQASAQSITVAFMPYENMRSVEKGKAVYACYLEFILCRKVGVVKEVYAGERNGVHPLDGRAMRGKTISLELTSSSNAEERSLIVGRPPLFF